MAAQDAATEDRAGLWAACDRVGTPLAPPDLAPTPASGEPPAQPGDPIAARTPAGNCDPSYPGVCVPPAPPDLDCGQVAHQGFQVVGADPHGFDRERDGIGCES